MPTAPSPASVALLLGLSFFLGLAFEDFFAQSTQRRPGGIRTFPMLALTGGVLYLLDPTRFIPFTAGLLVLGSWLIIYYRAYVGAADEQGEPTVGIVVPVLNVHAYLLGAAALALPPWVAVTMTVVAVLLLTGREQLHALARRVELKEIITAGQFLVLTGIVLPLLPNQPVTTLTPITPRQVWLALVVVCTFSYVSYLAQRYWAAGAGGLWMAALGGLYSSTATTVVLARQAKAQPALRRQAQPVLRLQPRSCICASWRLSPSSIWLWRVRCSCPCVRFRSPASCSAPCNIAGESARKSNPRKPCNLPRAAIRSSSAPPRSLRFSSLRYRW